MSDITKSDKNFAVEKHPSFGETAFYDIDLPPFELYGVFRENGRYRRMPEKTARSVNDGVYCLHDHTAGGRVRFKTDSGYVAIRAKMVNVCKMPHFPFTGSAGFDMYEKKDGKWIYIGTFIPPFDITDGYESIIYTGNREQKELIINMPLYSGVERLEIGLEPSAQVLAPEKYINTAPAVFYGSSITQGGCASRPGTCYQSIISRKFELDYINLGFSGSAKGEKAISDYMAGLEMNMFILDYDHNAPDVQHLEATHYGVYAAVRQAHPDIPVILMSRPKFHLTGEEQQRLEVVRATFEKAKADGDRNIVMLDGAALMQDAPEEGTVDNCHPNDLGFMSMARAVEKAYRAIIMPE
ncbi:MAG: SGNH/GDSL hydrolase family protein [Clostridia bacterium]|nr:SGNH/GDSL hydrolase family protein [Clostridia bacterium]